MPAAAPDPSRAAGFTLVETLVALVILAASLLVFYEFLAGALNGAAAAERAATAYDRRQSALALASSLNPMETPEGSFDLGPYRIHWRAERIGAVRQSSGFPSGKGPFSIGLYRVVLDFPGERGLPEVEVTKLGYHREAAPGEPPAEGVN
jgi:prepilin-type N-terminal cleavage/methylation domain-containing protein